VPAGFAEQVDITAAVQDAVAAGVSPVPVVLTARVPGHLELAPVGKVNFLRTHGVQFAQGDTTVIDTAEEGEVDVLLPLPAVSRSWVIHRVVSTVTAEDRGPQRVLPAVGPDELLEAELTLDADRPIVACLPAAALAPFATLTAARVRLAAGPGGIGVVGGLLGGNPARPGEPVPGGEVPEVTVAPSGTPEWVTLPFAKPVALPAEGTLWLSLAATRGRAVLGLRAVPPPQPATLTDDERGIAVIRRVAPNGVVKAMSAPVGLRTDGLALRLAGTAPDGAPIDLLSVALAGVRPLRRAGRAATKPEIVEVPSTAEPGDGPDRFVRALPVPAPVERLTLRATAFAATRLTVGPVVVAYEESPVPRVTEGAER
jgi:hypothetical protein